MANRVAAPLAAAIAFLLGIVVATPIKSAMIAITGGESIRCVRTICVGDAPFPGLERPEVTDQIGGLNAVQCGDMGALDPLHPPRLLRINALLAGETCAERVYRLDFNELVTGTSIEVRDGRISEIRTYPVHAITFP